MDRALEAIYLALARAEDALARLDERVRACPFAKGWIARLDFNEAVAFGWTSGHAVSMEDLVLHDQDMDRRLPEHALRSTYALVRARRKAAAGSTELLSAEGAAWLVGARKRPPMGSPTDWRPIALDPADLDRPDVATRLVERLQRLALGATDDGADGVTEWLDFLRAQASDTPDLLHAAAALEAWSLIAALPGQPWIGPLLVARWLADRGRIVSHLVGLESGVRAHARMRRDFSLSPASRIAYWLRIMADAGGQGVLELQRLELARQVLARRFEGLRVDARLKDVVALLLERPVVTAPMVAQTLKVSQTTARRLIEALGAGVAEVTGRTRFRAWRI